MKAGTQTDTTVRLKGKGVPTLRNKEVRGDHYVKLVVNVPTRLSNEAKEALKAFDAASGDYLNATQKDDKSSSKDKKKKKGLFG